MAFSSQRGSPTRRRSWTWFVVGSIGLLAALAGSALPQLVPGTAPLVAAPPKQEAATKGDLHYTEQTWPETPSSASMLARLAIGTGVVLVLCVGTLWAGKRWLVGPITPKTTTGSQQLRVVEAVALGNRCAIHLIQVGHRQVLVGVDASGMKAVVPLGETFEHTLDGVANSPPGSHTADTDWLAAGAHGL